MRLHPEQWGNFQIHSAHSPFPSQVSSPMSWDSHHSYCVVTQNSVVVWGWYKNKKWITITLNYTTHSLMHTTTNTCCSSKVVLPIMLSWTSTFPDSALVYLPPGSLLCLVLSPRHRNPCFKIFFICLRDRSEGERVLILWFIPQMPIIANVGWGRSQEPGFQSMN